MKNRILQAVWMVEWLTMEDGAMGDDSNNVWDWDGNNNN